MLFLFKRNDSWVLPFNILLIIGFFLACTSYEGGFSFLLVFWLLFVLAQSVFINVFLERFALLKQKSHVPQIVSALILIALIPYKKLDYSILIAVVLQYVTLFSLMAYNEKIVQNYKHGTFLFNHGVVLSVSTLIYFPMVYGIFAFGIAFLLLFGFRIKDFLLFLVGICFPLIYYYSYLYLFDTRYAFWITNPIQIEFNNAPVLLFTSTLAVIAIIGMYRVLVKLGVKNIKVRNASKILLTYFIVFLISTFISKDHLPFILLSTPFLVFCLSFIFLNPKSKWFSAFLFLGFSIAFALRFISWDILLRLWNN